MAAPTRKTLLSLDTLEGYSVTINGAAYRLHAPDGLPAYTYKRLSTMSVRLEALWQQEALSPEEEQELGDVLDRLCRLVLEAPDTIHGQLSDMQRLAIFQSFQMLPTATLQRIRRQMAAGATPIGARSRPSSRGSTAGRRGTGSAKRRSASSEPATP